MNLDSEGVRRFAALWLPEGARGRRHLQVAAEGQREVAWRCLALGRGAEAEAALARVKLLERFLTGVEKPERFSEAP